MRFDQLLRNALQSKSKVTLHLDGHEVIAGKCVDLDDDYAIFECRRGYVVLPDTTPVRALRVQRRTGTRLLKELKRTEAGI